MTALTPRRMLRLAGLFLLVVGTSSCAVFGGNHQKEGPFLRAGQPIGPLPGYEAAPVLGMEEALLAPAGMPAGFSAEAGLKALPSGYLPGVSPVKALVVSVSLGNQQPEYLERDLQKRVFGATEHDAGSVAEYLFRASRGGLRFSAEVLPTLIDTRRLREGEVLAPEQLRALVRKALGEWAKTKDLSVYDNEGPDGIPHSADDDSRLDMVFLALESNQRMASVTLAGDFVIQTPRGKVKVGKVHVVSVPRSERLRSDEGIALVMDALGLDRDERFFPADYPRGVSTLARARLGWIPVKSVAASSGVFSLEEQQAVMISLRELEVGAGFWLVERDGGVVYASRAARKKDGHYYVNETHKVSAGGKALLVLNRQKGARGPGVFVEWPRGAKEPLIELVPQGAGAEWAMEQFERKSGERLAAEGRYEVVDGVRLVGVAVDRPRSRTLALAHEE